MTQKRRSPLGPWVKVYVSVLDTKAHYSDAQFRALVEVWTHSVRQTVRGQFANRSVLDRWVGREVVDFLISQGDLDVLHDGVVRAHRWGEYQSGVLSTGRGELLPNSSGTVPEQSENSSLTRARDALYTLPSKVVTTEDEGRSESREGDFDENDPLEGFYLVTNRYPTAPNLKRWIRDVASTGPSALDFYVTLKAEFPKAHGDVSEALMATKAKLGQMADRAAASKRSEPKKIDPLREQMKAAIIERYGPEPDEVAEDATPEAIAAGRAAFEALRASSESLVRSVPNGPARKAGPTLTVDEGSDRESAAAVAGIGHRETGTISALAERLDASLPVAEPGVAEPGRPN